MDELRWFLLIVGIAVIAAVFIYGRVQDWRHDGPPWRRKRGEARQPFAGNDLNDPELHGELNELDDLISEQSGDGTLANETADRSSPASSKASPGATPSAPPDEPDTEEEAAEPVPREPAPTAEEAAPVDPVTNEASPAGEAPPPEQEPAERGSNLGRVSDRLRGVFRAAPQPDDDADNADDEEPPTAGEEKIVSVNVMAPHGSRFAGPALVEALETNALRHGAHGIFHRTMETRNGVISLYSAANIVKPGWFDLDAIEDFETPGVVFFMQLPGPFDGLSAFEQMLQSARAVASQLGGQLLDGRRCDLTQQTLEHVREELVEYRRRAHLAARQVR